MAKKKSKKQTSKYAFLVAVIFGLLAVASIFLPAFKGVSKVGGAEDTFTGIQTALGYKESTEILGATITTEILKINLFSLLAYALPLAGVVLLVIFKNVKLFNFISFGAFVASGVFAFISINTFPSTVIGSELTSALVEYSLGLGSILCGALSIIAGLATLVKLLKK